MDVYYGYSQPRSYGPWDHNQGAPYSAQRGRATSESMMPGGGYMRNDWRNWNGDQYAYGYNQPQWSYNEFQWSGPQEQSYPYYEPQYMDQEQYHDSNPYQDSYQYQSPPQEFTPVSNTLQEIFDEFMRKTEERSIEHKESQRQFAIQHQQYLEQWKQFEDKFGMKC